MNTTNYIVMLNKRIQLLIMLAFCMLLSGCVKSDALALFNGFVAAEGPVRIFISATAYLFGIGFAFKGVFALKQYGEMRSMMSTSASIKAPVIYLLVTAALMYVPSAVSTMNQTIFGANFPLDYQSGSFTAQNQLAGIFAFVRIVGYVAFVRGWIYIAGLAQQGQHQSIGKAFTHIFGGVLAINIQATAEVLQKAFGV